MNEEEKQPEPAKPPKYIRVFSIEQANTRHKEGYRVHSVIVTQDTLADQNPRSHISYLMSLSQEKAYDDITSLKDVPPDEVDGYLAEGWIVADSWSKLVRMVKKRVEDEAQ